MKRALLAVGTTAAGLAAVLSYDVRPVAVPVAAASGTSAAPAGSTSPTSRTLTGAAASTRWGPVQVQVELTDGRITGVTVLRSPDGNGRDRQINAHALPVLEQEALDAQSAQLDVVSGATYTSQGYAQSLQSALDQR